MLFRSGVIGALLIAFFLVDSMRKYTAPGGIDQKRAEERRKNLQELRQAEALASTAGVIDAGKGVYRLKIEDAMRLTLNDMKNPQAFKKDLVARAVKANAVAPPKPNEFE